MKTVPRRGFTLVELLVVIGIIALLAALLFPVFQTGRRRSHEAGCLSNLSQIGKAVALYAADYDDALPHALTPSTTKLRRDGRNVFDPPLDTVAAVAPDVRDVLKPYGAGPGPIWRCALDQIDWLLASEGGHQATWFEECGSSYRYDEDHALRGRSLSGYPRPAQNELGSDMSGFHGSRSRTVVGPDPNARVNMLFADLHVKNVSWPERVKIHNSDPTE